MPLNSSSMAHKPTAAQKRNAMITGVVLAVMALAVYAVVILKYVTKP